MNTIALASPLFSRKRGLSPLLRSLLANKNIRHVIVTGEDLDDVHVGIKQLFTKGIRGHSVVGTDITLDKELPVAAIKKLLENVDYHDFCDKHEKITSFVKKLKHKPSYGKNVVYPEPKLTLPQVFPSEKTGFSIHGDTLVSLQTKLLQHILRFGEVKRHINEQPTKDVSCVTLSTLDCSFHKELTFAKKDGDKYRKQILQKKQSSVYSYGNRIQEYFGCDQLSALALRLKKNPYSRRMLTLFIDPCKDMQHQFCPGAVYAHVGLVDHSICVTVHLRSMDAWQGVTETMHGFAALRDYIAEQSGFPAGAVNVVLDTCYLQYADMQRAAEFVQRNHTVAHQNKHNDPRGNVVISVHGGYIHLELVGEAVLQKWKAKRAKTLYKQLSSYFVLFDEYHKFDIGAELQKAEFALLRDEEYHQDRVL